MYIIQAYCLPLMGSMKGPFTHVNFRFIQNATYKFSFSPSKVATVVCLVA